MCDDPNSIAQIERMGCVVCKSCFNMILKVVKSSMRITPEPQSPTMHMFNFGHKSIALISESNFVFLHER